MDVSAELVKSNSSVNNDRFEEPESNPVHESRYLEMKGLNEDDNAKLLDSSDKSSDDPQQNYFFSLYKQTGLPDKQAKRREELLKEQKRLRNKSTDEARGLNPESHEAMEGACAIVEDLETEMESEDIPSNKRFYHKKKPFYKLMLSEWLIEVPDDLDISWFVKLCPTGHRCLVVAGKYVTNSYSRFGKYECTFMSMLPGGNPTVSYKYTVLDCIWVEESKTFYVLDILLWNGQDLTTSEADFRFFWLQFKLGETEGLDTISTNNEYIFKYVKHHCFDHTTMKEIFDTKDEPVIDGVLFYHREGSYTKGVTPLVGWLKPYMLPEKLNIPVCPEYMSLRPERYVDLQSHIAYGKKMKKQGRRKPQKETMETDESESLQVLTPIT